MHISSVANSDFVGITFMEDAQDVSIIRLASVCSEYQAVRGRITDFKGESAKIKHRQDAINLLDSRRRDVRPIATPEVAEGLKAMPMNSTFKGKPSLSGMKDWLASLGHSVSPPWDHTG